MAFQHFPDDQTLQLQTGAGEDDIIHLPSGLDRVDCERQEEEEEPISADTSPCTMRKSVRSHIKGEVSELSRELLLCGDAWDTQICLNVCLTMKPPHRICQQL